ncbi:RagB/SusD family nutrient uptake outer membrane protein [soil metagenome]
MKSKYLILSAVILAAGCQSSDQLLDVVSPTTVSDAIFWTQEAEAQLFVTGTYSALPGWFDVMGLDGLTDNGAVNRQFDNRYIYTDGTYDPQSAYSRGLWNQFYNGVARTNILLANIDRIPAAKIDPTRKARYIAETKFLRGMMYLQLVSMFGDVPMPLVPVTDAEGRAMTVTPSAKVYDQILLDFDAAAAVLPSAFTGADYGRATKWAALGMKARAALYAGRLQIAADAAKAVMDGGVFQLNPSYSQLFTYAGETNKEAVFVHTYSKTAQATGTNNNVFGEFGPPTNSAAGHVVPLRALLDSYQMTDGKSIVTSPLYNPAPWPNAGGTMFDNRDPRMAATLLYPGASWDGGTFDPRPIGQSTKPEAFNLGNENVSTTGLNIRKYIDLTDKADRGNGGIDFMLLRYADILLMFAEAKVDLGQADASALAAINLVRTRAGMPALAAVTQADVRYERRAELAFEGLRLFDIRRWKLAPTVMVIDAVTGADYIDANGAKKTLTQPASGRKFFSRDYTFPIPQAEIDLNSNLKGQNGW